MQRMSTLEDGNHSRYVDRGLERVRRGGSEKRRGEGGVVGFGGGGDGGCDLSRGGPGRGKRVEKRFRRDVGGRITED